MQFSISKKFLQLFSLILFTFNVMAAETKDTLVLTQQLITPQIQGGSSHLLFLTSGPSNDQIFIVDGSEVLRLLATGDIELSNLAPSTVPYIDSGQVLQSSSVTPTELQNVHGSTSALCGITQACTLTNKTLTSPAITTPTGIVKGDVGLGNVDNTSDATKNSASVTLTNKGISGSANTITNIPLSAFTNLGTTTQVLHGNAAGNPTFSQVGLTTDVTGVLPIANGGTNNGSLAVTAGGVPYTDGSKLVNVGAGTSGFVLTSAGASAPTWKAATAGAKNYLAAYNGNTGNGNFELGATTGWSLGTTGTLTNGIPTGSPTFGSGASGNLSISTVTSGSQIAGTYSLTYISSAATTVGNMLASDAFTIDTEDQAKVMAWQFYYKAVTNPSNANWTGTSSNSLAVAIYDVTNSAWIIPQGNFNLIQSSGVGLASGSFQTSATGTSYRFVIYNANATAGAITDYFDDVQLGPSSSAGSILNTLIASAHITSGTTIVTPNPFNFDTIDTDTTASITTGASWKFTAPFSTYYYVETTLTFGGAADVVLYKNGAKYRVLMTTGASGSAGGTFVQLNAGDNIYIAANANAAPSTTSTGTIAQSNHISIFIIGNQGAGPAGLVVASSAHNTTGSITSGAQVNFDTVDLDTTASISTGASWKYTALYTGNYVVEASLYSGGTSFAYSVFKNGSIYRAVGIGASATGPQAGGTIVPCNAGDTLDIRPNASATLSGLTGATAAQTNYINIFLLQGPSGGSVTAQPVYLSASSTYSVPQMNAVISFSGASFTATLPTAVGFPGRTFTFIHNGTSLSQVYTLATTGGQTIGGVASGSYAEYTNNEILSIISDGANYQITNHKTDTSEVAYTPTFTGFGTVASVNSYWFRHGPRMHIRIGVVAGTVAASTATMTLPGGMTTSASIYGTQNALVGQWHRNVAGAESGSVIVTAASSTTVGFSVANATGADPTTPVNGNSIMGTGNLMTGEYDVSVAGFQP